MTMEAGVCPECERRSRVVETRVNRGLLTRRRECVRCGHRWNTVEIRQDDLHRTAKAIVEGRK
jgi:transcriptional regulator NrdR family protein